MLRSLLTTQASLFGETSSALLSRCGRYRYSLTRDLGAAPGRSGTWLSISINPSTADATTNDHTIRKDMGFAERHGCRRLVKGNLFALRSRDPMGLLSTDDPVGEGNDDALRAMLAERPRVVLCAWGAWTGRIGKLVAARVPVVLEMIRAAGLQPTCLGTSANGSPLHPLMLAYSTPLQPFHPERTDRP